jgi:phosphohistidine phosphatase SixA
MMGVKVVLEKSGLEPNDPVAPIADALRNAPRDRDRKTIMIVGHMPFLGKLVSYLKTGFEDKEPFDFGSGQVIRCML